MKDDRENQQSQHPNLDSVTTIRDDGSRRFLFPSDVRGRFTQGRLFAALGLIAIYIVLPWVEIGGYPAVFLDVASRRFHLFGLTLAAQDLWLLFFLISGAGFTLFFITSLLGRLWCGWTCPHTVFLDHVYRPIERFIDGEAKARRALEEREMDADKLVRRIVKHTLYILASAAIAHIFLAYFVSLPQLWHMMSSAPGENWSTFGFVFITTGILYFNFAWFREQLCIVICPYGRLQSALIDDNSLVIGYDTKRGEPRGKKGTAGAGDCVACDRCVKVCPTGIDIRQGLQLECIGCAACVDACDDVMTRLGKPKGLVRYDSLQGLAGKRTHWLRPRTIIYFILLIVGAVVSTLTISARLKPANFAITRMVGTPYVVDSNNVRNQFMIRIVNKTSEPAHFSLSAEINGKFEQTGLTGDVVLAPMEEVLRPLVLSQNRKDYQGPFNFVMVLKSEKHQVEFRRDAKFLGPDAQLLKEEDREKGIQR